VYLDIIKVIVHYFMIKSVVMWLHILVMSLLMYVYVALFGSRLLPNSAT